MLTIVYTGVVASAFGWLLLAMLLRRHEVGVVSSVIFLVPVLAAGFGIVILGEAFSWHFLVGLCLVVVGIKLVTMAERPMGVAA